LIFSQMARQAIPFELYSDGGDSLATPADVIDVISEKFGVPRPTVAQHDRLLAINGHRRISGRGRAARAQPEDAAALLIAVAASSAWGPAVKETIRHFEIYAGLRALQPLSDRPANWRGVKPFAGLSDGHSLREVLTQCIRSHAGGAFKRAADVWVNVPRHLKGKLEEAAVSIAVTFHLPFPEVNIKLTALSDEPDAHEAELELNYYMSVAAHNAQARSPLTDLNQVRTFGSFTLDSLGHLFRSESGAFADIPNSFEEKDTR
jgi:hypothetical protein